METLTIAYATDENYAKLVWCSLKSLLENNANFFTVKAYIISDNLSNSSKDKLSNLISSYNGKICFIEFDSIAYGLDNACTFQNGKTSYARLFLAQIVKENKILYLDCDTLINHSLCDLWNTDLEGYYIAGVKDIIAPQLKQDIQLLPTDIYINAGILLINIQEWKKNKIESQFIAYIRKNLSLWAIGPKWNRNIFIKCAFYCYVIPIRIMQSKSRKKFDEYTRKYLHLTQRYNSFQELLNNPPEADIYFCGSDQIWNTQIKNGLDPAFYCDFAPMKATRASYAASFSISQIPKEHESFVKSQINKLNYISVRENSGLKILYNLGIKKGVHVVDPVFLLSSNQWMQLATLPIYNNYILVYDQENNATIKKIALYLSKKSGKKIVAFKDLYPRTYADYQERYAGPTEFIGLIAKADIVITNSFHCSAFSIIMNRQFYVIPRTHQKVNSRMENLLSSLEIRNRFITSIEDINNATEIDYNKVTPLIESMKEQSYKYISNVLASQSNS